MYFVKARKQLDEQDANDREKLSRNRYQRSDSARLLLQAVPPVSSQTTHAPQEQQQEWNKPKPHGSTQQSGEFRPEELPDGACYRPKKDSSVNSARPMSPTGGDISSVAVDQQGSDETKECVRLAEYIGTFSVSGSDKQAREKQMEIQLQQMRGVSTVTPVHLMISVEGVKVINVSTQTPIMEHSLKRIWYATCDPEYCQFSFLAREPKTSAEVQYCHAFLTKTSQEAEELISLMGNAFKETVPPDTNTAATKKQPTFHELIEQQVQEQQAKFREIEKESKIALQKKLTEIATPTPFSEKVQTRMGVRRFSDGGGLDSLANVNKMWAKQRIAQQLNQFVNPDNNNSNNTNLNSHRRSEIPIHTSSPQSSPLKRNSVPPQVRENIISSNPSSVPSSPPHPLSAQAIRESLGSKQSSKFKGSPVTALKNEIDKRLVLDDMAAFPTRSDLPPTSHVKEKSGIPKPSMANRPLPSPPEESAQEPRGRPRTGRGGAEGRVRRSLDDNNIPMDPVGQVKMRNSPRRGQTRPMSEIAVGSSSAIFHQQRQSLLHNFASSFNSPQELEAAAASGSQDKINISKKRNSSGNMYAPPPLQQTEPSNHNSPSKSRVVNVERRERSGGGETGRKRSDPLPPRYVPPPSTHVPPPSTYVPPPSTYVPPPSTYAPPPPQQNEQEVYEELVEDFSVKVSSATNGGGAEVLRYQNGSPFCQDDPESGGGLEALMNLDRSHIHDVTLRNAPWYQAGLAREIALDILQQEEVGAFIVRDSSTHPGCFALSVRVPRFENSAGISHYLILRTHRGVKLKGLDKEWSSLQALVTHHTVMREMLPCTLRMPKNTPPLSDEIRSSGDGMERGDNYTDMSSQAESGQPALKLVGNNF